MRFRRLAAPVLGVVLAAGAVSAASAHVKHVPAKPVVHLFASALPLAGTTPSKSTDRPSLSLKDGGRMSSPHGIASAPGAASAAPVRTATATSYPYVVLELAKVSGALHSVFYAGTTLASAKSAATSACDKFRAQAAPRYAPMDCTSGIWARYGWVAYVAADPNSVSPDFWAWGDGWAHTSQDAINTALKYCKTIGGSDCGPGAVASTPGYTGAQATTGGLWYNPEQRALLKAAAYLKNNPTSTKYNEFCEKYVEDMYGDTFRFDSAHANYAWEENKGRIFTDRNAPPGALVYFKGNSPSGHIGIATGDGKTYWTSDAYADGGPAAPHVVPYSEGIGYLGWSYPPIGLHS